MIKPDKDKLIPWLAVVFAGLLLGALGRYIALQQTGDTGTANLTFVIVLGGVVFMYILFITLWESIQQLIAKKRKEQEQSDDLPEDDDDEPETIGI
jgi:cbb3-type cytochrome oxidase subunit 3